MKTAEETIEYIRAVMGHAKLSPLFRDVDLYNYIASVLGDKFLEYDERFKIMDLDMSCRRKIDKRIETFKTIVSSLCTFPSDEIKEYIMNSISSEMGMAYSIGRFGTHAD